MLMNENPSLYNKSNNITISDATTVMEQYAQKLFQKEKRNIKIIDIGSGDGSVTAVLEKYLPEHYAILFGGDLSETMVKFANDHYQSQRTKFIILDIENDLPEHLKANFDYVFSFCTFHWIKQQRKGFENIHRLLTKGGQCLMTFFAYLPTYTIFLALSETDKWKLYLEKVNDMLSPYYNLPEPDRLVTATLEDIGFQSIDVRCKQMIYVYENINEYRDLIEAINPFKIPQDKIEEFLNDYMDMARAIRIVNDNKNTLTLCYNLIVVHCTK